MAKPTTFVITDKSVNVYGFRVLSSGANVKNFKKNPVMFFNHLRGGNSWNPDPNYSGPIGRWDNLTLDGSEWKADPVFDLDDPKGKSISDKVENDFIRAASIGFRPIESSTDPKLMLPGQTGPTITKWELIEVSVVDIGANKGALALYDNDLNQVDLNDQNALAICLSAGNNAAQNLSITNKNSMKIKILSAWAALSAFLSLNHKDGETSTEVELSEAQLAQLNNDLSKLNDLESKLNTANASIQTLSGDKTKLEADLATANAQIKELKGPENPPAKPVLSSEEEAQKLKDAEENKPKNSWELKAERLTAAAKA